MSAQPDEHTADLRREVVHLKETSAKLETTQRQISTALEHFILQTKPIVDWAEVLRVGSNGSPSLSVQLVSLRHELHTKVDRAIADLEGQFGGNMKVLESRVDRNDFRLGILWGACGALAVGFITMAWRVFGQWLAG